MAIEIKVPSVGESISEVEIGEWLKKEGESVKQDESLVLLDSAKTTVELPSPASGVVAKISLAQGEVAQIGDIIGTIEEGEVPVAKKPETKVEKQETAGKPTTDDLPPVPQKPSTENGFVMPSAARVLHEKGLSSEDATATGPGGRVLKEDAQRAQKPAAKSTEVAAEKPLEQVAAPSQITAQSTPPTPPQQPQAAQPLGEDEEAVPMSFLRRQISKRLVEAQQTAALLTTFNEVDMSAAMAMRKEHQDAFVKKYGVKLGYMSIFVKAAVDALKLFPQINAEIRDKTIIYKNHYDIGVAIGGGKGLVVPVLRRAERMSFADVELGIADFASRVKENKLLPDELSGGTFTITNGGVFGSLLSTPIVNPPQSGILGMHSIQDRPIALGGQVVIRPMMYIALTYDHRIVDGREAVQFLVRIKDCVENPARMLIEA